MNIDLNKFENNFDKPNKIFNNGNSGEVVVSIEAQKKDNDNPNSPDWVLVIKDKLGRTITEGQYYLDRNFYSSDEKFSNALNYTGRYLTHIVHGLYGKDIQLPSVESPKEMLDVCMNLIQEKQPNQVKVGVTFGTINKPNKKGYLGLKRTFPFITGNLEEAIKFNPSDILIRPIPSNNPSPQSSTDDEGTPW